MTFRQRIEHSRILAWLLAAIASSYLSLCQRTTRWEYVGLGQAEIRARRRSCATFDVARAVTDGPNPLAGRGGPPFKPL